MNAASSADVSATATAFTPKFSDGPAEVQGDVHLRQRYFTYRTAAGLVVGKTLNVMFTIDRPVHVVWPYFKDFNRWQNVSGHYYSGVVGDLEGKSFRISNTPDESGPHQYHVLRVIPEHTIVLSQLVAEEARADMALPQPGGFSPGFHVFLLNEHDGRTIVTCLMEHATQTQGMTEDEALSPWQKMAPGSHQKFRDKLIPHLKRLVCEGQQR